jgi:hypothetical protein
MLASTISTPVSLERMSWEASALNPTSRIRKLVLVLILRKWDQFSECSENIKSIPICTSVLSSKCSSTSNISSSILEAAPCNCGCDLDAK